MSTRPVLLLLLLLFGYGFVGACTCAYDTDSVEVSYEIADIALKGQVVSKEIVANHDTIYEMDERGDTVRLRFKLGRNAYTIYRIEILEIYKGEWAHDTIEVKGPAYSTCVATLQADGYYFVFVGESDNHTFYTNYCLGNRKFNASDEAILRSLKD